MIELSNKYILHLESMIFEEIAGRPVRVFLFGSRAKGDASAVSDVDVALLGPGRLDRGWLARLRERLEESTIPYKVDLVDLNDVANEFRNVVFRSAKEWKPEGKE
jgi:predicted nucleotidyltransferase